MKLEDLQVKRYLDSDQRPGAVALSPSKAKVNHIADRKVSFEGELGAIKGDRLAKHVGFIGLELNFMPISVQDLAWLLKSICLSEIQTDQEKVTFTIQVMNQEQQRFAIEKSLIKDIDQLNIQEEVSHFTGIWRGKYQPGLKLKPSDQVCALVVCLRRSQNRPNDIKPIKINFNLSFA